MNGTTVVFTPMSIPMETIDPTSPAVKYFINRDFKGKKIQRVKRSGSAPTGQCYRNVDLHVDKFGGSVQYGWLLCWWPGHLIEAVHHAVWRKPNGEMIDITTPAYQKMTGSFVYFILDNKTTYSGLGAAVPSKFGLLIDSPGLRDYIQFATWYMQLAGLREAAIRRIGYKISGSSIILTGDGDAEVNNIDIKMRQVREHVAHYAAKFARGDLSVIDDPISAVH